MRCALLGQATPGTACFGDARSAVVGSDQLRWAKVQAKVLGFWLAERRENLSRMGQCPQRNAARYPHGGNPDKLGKAGSQTGEANLTGDEKRVLVANRLADARAWAPRHRRPGRSGVGFVTCLRARRRRPVGLPRTGCRSRRQGRLSCHQGRARARRCGGLRVCRSRSGEW